MCLHSNNDLRGWYEAIRSRQPRTITVCSHPADRRALMALYASANGGNWARKSGWGTNQPVGNWDGVTTNVEGRVTKLELVYTVEDTYAHRVAGQTTTKTREYTVGYGLNGSIPEEIGLLTELTHLDLRHTGRTPPNLLRYFEDEDGNHRYTYSSGRNKWTQSYAFLRGTLPNEIESLTNLTYLNLSQQKIDGAITETFQGLDELTELYLPESVCVVESLQTWYARLTSEHTLPTCVEHIEPRDDDDAGDGGTSRSGSGNDVSVTTTTTTPQPRTTTTTTPRQTTTTTTPQPRTTQQPNSQPQAQQGTTKQPTVEPSETVTADTGTVIQRLTRIETQIKELLATLAKAIQNIAKSNDGNEQLLALLSQVLAKLKVLG